MGRGFSDTYFPLLINNEFPPPQYLTSKMRLLTLLLLLSGQVFAQDFHRYYDLGGAESIRDLIVLTPERLVAIGNSRDTNGLDRSVLLTLDGKGEVLRSTTLDYELRTRGMTLARQTDSTFWMGCWRTPFEIIDDWVVYRVNANTGEATGFGWGAEDVDEQIRAMAPYPDGGVVVVGNTGDRNEAIISRLDAQGNELFRRGFSIPDNQFTIFTDVKIAPNGNIIAAGGFLRTGGPTSKNGYLIAEFTPAGELLRSRRYDFPEGEDGSDGAGVALALLPQGFTAIVGARRFGENRQAVTFILSPDLGVAGAFQGQATQFSTARDVLALREERLLIVGTGSREGEKDGGLVTDFDVAGTGVPINVLLGNRAADNRLNGVAARPGGGYYFYGQGNLCDDEDGSDGLLISIGPSLTDTVANCFSVTGNANGQEILPSSEPSGVVFDRQDPRFGPPAFTAITTTATERYCPRIAARPVAFPDPICYETPFLLLGSAALVSPEGSVHRVLVNLGGADAGAMDYLEIMDPPVGVVVEGNRSRRLILSLEEQGGASTLLLEALSSLRFGVDGSSVNGGRRVIGIQPASSCQSRQFIDFDFNLAPYAPAPFGLPTDTTLCTGTDLILAGPDLPGVTYRWSNGDETRTTVIDEPGDYTLWVSTGCREDSATVRVAEAMDAPELMDFNVRESVCLGDSLVFALRPEEGLSYAWADGLPGAESRVFRAAGTYELIRTNACFAAITTVDVNFRDCCQLYLPNAFSPNGDGINDVFRAFPDTDKCELVSEYELLVYDRWGGEVYAGTELIAGWDGMAKGQSAGNGHYVYVASYFNGQERIVRSGGFVLLR